MSTKKAINQEMITKVLKLHKNAVPKVLIAETLGCSKTSVKRIVTLMEAAQNGENIDKILNNSYPRMKKLVKEYFGITEIKEQIKPKQTPDNELLKDFGDFAVRVLFELNDLNKNLEKLLIELGVEV